MKFEDILNRLPPEDRASILETAAELFAGQDRERAIKNFMPFVKMMWPGFIDGRHHKVMAKKFEEIAQGKTKRLIINMPPRHTKSEFASYLLPAWFLGKYPNKKIIQCSNTAELAVGFGRKVRNLVGSEQYGKVFPNVSLRSDSKAAGRWSTNANGEYFAIGVGGTVTGKGADLLIIDDPHSEQEAALASADPSVFDKVYEWYTSGPRQRLQPGGSIIIVMCMTGDTPILMANGKEKFLKDIRVGDIVATFDSGKLKTARVNNWMSNGVDSVYTLQTQSGKIVKANERHPFLIDNNGVLEWTRVNQLKIGDELVSMKDAIGFQIQKLSRECANPAKQKKRITKKILMLPIERLAFMESIKEKFAQLKGVIKNYTQMDYVQPIIISKKWNLGYINQPQNKEELEELKIGTGLPWKIINKCFQSKMENALFAVNHLLKKTLERIGTENYVLTTAMKQKKFEGYFATPATLPLDIQRQQKLLSQLHLISDFTVDPIVSITYSGEEEVFDVEIDKTENFIANGLVSHNTRWSKRDLTGKILKAAVERDGDDWEMIDFPAILPSEKPLWPEFWSYEELCALRTELPLPKWQDQYQQQPTSEEGAIIKREWWKVWDDKTPPRCEYIIQSWDTAFTKTERSDYSACTTWGVFYLNENPNDPNVILLDAFKKRMEFPELKEQALRHYREYQPDAFIVEAKASGAPLIYELRQMGIPVQEFTPTRGNDKIVRINSVSDLFSSGKIWAPSTRWAEEVVEEMASFPNSDHDDLVDSSTQALIRFRKGGFIRLQTDEWDDVVPKKRASYY